MTMDLNEANEEMIGSPTNKNILTVGCAMQFAGISDIEFIKASFILNIAVQMTLRVRPEAIQFVRGNFSWLSIYYATVLQNIDRRELEG